MSISKADLAKIHIAKKDLCLDDETYRALLKRVAGVTSSADLTVMTVGLVLTEFKRLGWMPKRKAGRAKPKVTDDKQKITSVITAQLAEFGRPFEYGDAMAKRMFGIERLEWLDCEQLQKVSIALRYDSNRRNR